MSKTKVYINSTLKEIELGENDSIEKIESELNVANEFIIIDNFKIRKSSIIAIEFCEEYNSIETLLKQNW